MAPYHVTYHPDLSVVECIATGFLTVNELMDAAVQTIAMAIEKDTACILVDDSEVEKTVGTVDIYNLPQLYNNLNIDRNFKVAVILPRSPEAKEGVQFYETVCQNRGWNIEVFEKRQKAIDWLTGRDASNTTGEGDS